MKFDGKLAARRLVRIWLRTADDAQGGPWHIEMDGRRRKNPSFQLLDKLGFMLRLLNLGKAGRVGVRSKLSRERTLGAHEQESHLFQAAFALGGKQARPPIGGGKVLAREGE